MKYKFKWCKLHKWILFLLLPSFQLVYGGGTVVGDGGDPIFEFLEATRFSMIESIKILINDPAERKVFCQQKTLNLQQKKFCSDYFLSIASEVLRLNQGLEKTLFVLREKSLEVIGPDGKPMMVAARTDLGSNGPIEFHRDSIKTIDRKSVV